MATPINIVAQYVMDSYYQDFKQESEFFDLPDFVFHSGATVADYYRQDYEKQRAEIRQEKSDEIVTFTDDVLVPVTLQVKNNASEKLPPILSFAYDRQNSGVQEVIVTNPDGVIVDRTNIAQIWQMRYLPKTNRIFWYLDRGVIKFYNVGDCNVNAIDVLYVPGISPTMMVPDSLIDWTVNNTVQKMKAIKQGVVVKQSINNNMNPTLETEMDKSQLK
jgi:hypothetical protein